jgi:hypothetical protein
MSKNSIKAVDLYIRVLRCSDLLSTATPDEMERYTKKRDKALQKYRKALHKITLEEFLNGRWSGICIEQRMNQWNDMQTVVGGPIVSRKPVGALEEEFTT